MMMKSKFKMVIFTCACVAVLCFSSLFSSVYATNDLEEYNTDNMSGWTLKKSKAHRGSKGYLYKY